MTQDEIRRSLVNMSRSRSKALTIPVLDEVEWDDLDFFSWADGRDLSRAYLVVQRADQLVGVELRATRRTTDFRRKSICGLCFTTHPVGGTALFSSLKGGKEGRLGNSVGLYMCRNLACSLYARRKIAAPMGQMDETLDLDDRIGRIRKNLAGFLAKVLQ
ncbi:FBP domain-containing protein [Streptomyces lunaelactis]|uniref:FBP domain-containing protein n=1 Tax=Streptomyces lunaelactis TaxID=1535768 RepID=UPI00211DA14B|nr:FBP domain-containing protein [Streptomyces lunaelactis]